MNRPFSQTSLSGSFPWPTALIIAINVALYLAIAISGGEFIDFDSDVLGDWGGNLAILSLTGDYWRLFANMFLHGGLMHLVANMYMLVLIGPMSERRFGKAGMIAVYLVGGLWASFCSAAWSEANLFQEIPAMTGLGVYGTQLVVNLIVSVGASGAIMALCGSLLASALLSGSGRQDAANNHLFKLLFQVVAINVVLGFMVPGIDQSAHIGGLVAGFALGAAVGTVSVDGSGHRRTLRVLATALIGVILLALAIQLGDWQDAHEVREQWELQTGQGR